MNHVGLLIVLFATGCQVLFPLDNVAPDAPPSPPKACVHDGLVLCLPLDEVTESSTPDFSDRHLDATATGVVTMERALGETGIEVGLKSDVFVLGNDEFPTSTMYDLPVPFSFDVWLFSRGTNIQVALDNQNQFAVRIFEDNKIECLFVFVPRPGTQELVEIAPSQVVPRDQWHHVACVIDADGVHNYIDGVHTVMPLPGLATNTTGTVTFQVGKTLSSAANFLDGGLDNVRIWNRALTLDEVTRFSLGDED